MNHLEHLLQNKETFFKFMRQNFPLMTHSNVFFRDLQYAINSYFKLKETPVNYSKAEKIARGFIENLVKDGDFSPIDDKTWKVNIDIEPKKELIETKGV